MHARVWERNKCALAAEALRSWGTLRLRVTGTSMLPALWPGDVLTVQSHCFEQARSGELVLYVREGRFFVHRVIGKLLSGQEAHLITRGDCMPQKDPPVPAPGLLGRVTAIDRDGSILVPSLSLSPVGRIFACVLRRSALVRAAVIRLRASTRQSFSRQGFSALESVR